MNNFLTNQIEKFKKLPQALITALLSDSVKYKAKNVDISISEDRRLLFSDDRIKYENFYDLLHIKESIWNPVSLLHNKPLNWSIIFLLSISEALLIKTEFGTLKIKDCLKFFYSIEYRKKLLSQIDYNDKINGLEITALLKDEVYYPFQIEEPVKYLSYLNNLSERKYLYLYFHCSLFDLKVTLNNTEVKQMQYNKELYNLSFYHEDNLVLLSDFSTNYTINSMKCLWDGEILNLPLEFDSDHLFLHLVYEAIHSKGMLASTFFPDLIIIKNYDSLSPNFNFISKLEIDKKYEELIKQSLLLKDKYAKEQIKKLSANYHKNKALIKMYQKFLE